MADRNGYIGRAPSDSSIFVARQTFSPTGITTDFTFASGYIVGYLDAYLNGSRLIEGQDYTATDGSVISLTSSATGGDVLELVAYKAFNAATIDTAPGNLTVNNNLTVGGNLNVTGVTTLGAGSSVSFATTAFGLSGTPDITIRNLTGVAATFTGVVTASSFVGNVTGTATGLSGTPNITVGTIGATSLNASGVVTATTFSGNITGTAATFTGNVSIAGTLTYEDVTNVDSVGLITARTGVKVTAGGVDVTAGGLNITAGVSTFLGEQRVSTGAEKVFRTSGNTVNLVYNSSSSAGGNVGYTTNPSGNITLNVTGIPTSSDFDDHSITFAVIVNNTGTARTCTAVNLNGVSKTIRFAGGSLASALSGVTTTTGHTIFSFTGINTVGSASTTANYEVFGVVSGGFF